MLRRYHRLSPMMCCKPTKNELYYEIAAAGITPGFIENYEYWDIVEPVIYGAKRKWIVLEGSEGVIKKMDTMNSPSDKHIIVDDWEFLLLINEYKNEYVCNQTVN